MKKFALFLVLLFASQFAQAAEHVGKIPGRYQVAQFNGCAPGFCAPRAVTPAGSCSQSIALLARMDGGQNTSAVDTLICGLVTDGTYSLLDGLYVFVTNSTGNATLNWAQNAFNLTWTSLGTCTFAANSGITGDGTACFANTGFTPSTAGGQYTLDAASLGACVINNRTTPNSSVEIGAEDNFNTYSYIQPLISSGGSSLFFEINSNTFVGAANTTAQGAWIASRQGNNITALMYLNSSLFQTLTAATTFLTPRPIYIFAFNDNGSAGSFSTDKLGWALFGNQLSTGQQSSIRTRLQTYISAVGGSGC